MKHLFLMLLLMFCWALAAQHNMVKATITIALGKNECNKLDFPLKNNHILKGGINDDLLYLTADAHKVPVDAKFKILLGNGELKIKSATGLKN